MSSPNIITIYDLGAAEHVPYIAMEFIGTPDLKTVMRDGMSVADAVSYLKSLATALGVAHQRGIVHRDVEPSNLLFRADGTLLLSLPLQTICARRSRSWRRLCAIWTACIR